MTAGIGWFALNVKRRKEFVVARLLRGQGMEEFLPTYSGGRCLFPGLVFCRLDRGNRQAVLAVPGVLSIVGSSDSGPSISDAEIGSLKILLAARLPVRPGKLSPEGQRVRITQGPLAGLAGILVRKRDDFQIVVGVAALNRSVIAAIDREFIRALDGAPHADLARIFLTSNSL